MRVEHIMCGPFANASEEMAFRAIERRLKAEPGDGRAYILTNLVHGVGAGKQPDEIDIVVIATGGVVVIEVKHWDRSRLKNSSLGGRRSRGPYHPKSQTGREPTSTNKR